MSPTSTPTSSGCNCSTPTKCQQQARGCLAASLPQGEHYASTDLSQPACPQSQPGQPALLGGNQRCRSDEPVRHATHAQPAHRQELPDDWQSGSPGRGQSAARPEPGQVREQLPGTQRICPKRGNSPRTAGRREPLARVPQSGAGNTGQERRDRGAGTKRPTAGPVRKSGQADRGLHRQPLGTTGEPQRPATHAQSAYCQALPGHELACPRRRSGATVQSGSNRVRYGAGPATDCRREHPGHYRGTEESRCPVGFLPRRLQAVQRLALCADRHQHHHGNPVVADERPDYRL